MYKYLHHFHVEFYTVQIKLDTFRIKLGTVFKIETSSLQVEVQALQDG